MIGLLETALGKKAMIERQPLQPGDVPITFADISKASARLGYAPRVKAAEGIPKLCGLVFAKQCIICSHDCGHPVHPTDPGGSACCLEATPGRTRLRHQPALGVRGKSLPRTAARGNRAGFTLRSRRGSRRRTEEALDIAYDFFSETPGRVVFYRLGGIPDKSVCVLLCDSWFDKMDASEGYVRRDDWGVSFYPGLDDQTKEVTKLGCGCAA